MRITIASTNFVTGQVVNFKIYDRDGNLLHDLTGTEWVEGNYYVEVELSFGVTEAPYIVVATEENNIWQVVKTFSNPQQILDQNFVLEDDEIVSIAIPIFEILDGDLVPGFGDTDPYYEILNDEIVPKDI